MDRMGHTFRSLTLAMLAVTVTGCGSAVVVRATPTLRPTPVATPTPTPTLAPTILPTVVATPAPVVEHRAPPAVVHRVAAPPPRPAPTAVPKPAPRPPVAVFAATVQIGLINADRIRSGLAPYLTNACLMASARQSAARMAAQGFMSDGGAAANAACRLGTGLIGENVGWTTMGIQDSFINALFMNSAPHRANVLGHFRYIGTAWAVDRRGFGYIAVEFG